MSQSSSRSQPYQPSLLRLLHAVSGLLGILALITGFWVYSRYDGRFGTLPLPALPDIQGIHGTVGLFFLIVFPLLALYSFHLGSKRLVRSNSFAAIAQRPGSPSWWSNLQRWTNTVMLLAATFSVVTGRMMKEEWLPKGEVNHIWYLLHLTAWLVLLLSLGVHVLMSLKVGGVPLLLSMVSLRVRSADHPRHWIAQIRHWNDR